MIQHEFEELLEQFSQDELNEKSTVKGQFTSYITRRMEWHAIRYAAKNRPNVIVISLEQAPRHLTDIRHVGQQRICVYAAPDQGHRQCGGTVWFVRSAEELSEAGETRSGHSEDGQQPDPLCKRPSHEYQNLSPADHQTRRNGKLIYLQQAALHWQGRIFLEELCQKQFALAVWAKTVWPP